MSHQNGQKAFGGGFSSTNFFQDGAKVPRKPKQNASRSTGRPQSRNITPGNPSLSGNNNMKSYSNKPTNTKPINKKAVNKTQQKPYPKKLQTGDQFQTNKQVTTARKSNSFESKFMGSMLLEPKLLGYTQLNHEERPTPKYLLKEQVLFDSSSFVDNEWDRENQLMLQQRESEFRGDAQVLFEEFQVYREKERKVMEGLNLVDKENAKKSLNDAIVFRGSCQDMCPIYERVERVYKNQVSKWEKDPQTGKISSKYAMKTFMRPSGQAPPLPSDVRSPKVLQMSLNYIIENLLPNIQECQSFIWDRTRSIRQDFTFQNNYSGFESIDCHEKICRIHILSLHIMAGANDPDYQQQQELEQFNNSLKTLVNMYDDVKMRGGSCPNEPEFRAYEIIVKLKDFELERSIQKLQPHILSDSIVQRALMLRGLINHGINGMNMFTDFFKIVLDKNKTPFLLACLAEIHFNEIRHKALICLGKLYHSKSLKTPTVNDLTKMLGFDSEKDLEETCKIYGIEISLDEDQMRRVRLINFNVQFKRSQKQAYTLQINNMIGGRTMQQIVNEGANNIELNLAKPLPGVEIARQSFKKAEINTKFVDQIFDDSKSIAITSISTVSVDKRPKYDQPVFNNSNTPQNTQPVFNSTTDEKPSFSMENNSTNKLAPTNAATSFSFTPAGQNEPKLFPDDIKPRFTNNQMPEREQPKIEEIPSFIVPQQSVVQEQSKTKPSNLPSIEHIVVPPQPEPKKYLKEAKGYERAVQQYRDDLINEVIYGQMKQMTQKLLTNELLERRRITENNDKLKRQNFIEDLAEDLFEAFMNEQIYLNILESQAKNFDEAILKRMTISKFKKFSEGLLLKKAKIDEINEFKNKIVVPIKPNISQINMEKNIEKSLENSTIYNNEQIIKAFNNVNPDRDYSGLLILKNPNNSTSKWINEYLNFVDPKQKISTIVSDNNHGLTITKLPYDLSADKNYKDINLVILQVGTSGNDDPNISGETLTHDAENINKLYGYLKTYSSYNHFGFVIAYAGNSKKLRINEVIGKLGLKKYTEDVTFGFVDLSSNGSSANQSLAKKKKMLNECISKVLKKIISKEKDHKNSQPISNLSMNESISIQAGKSLNEIIKPMNKEFLDKFEKKRHDRVKEILSATKVKRRKMLNDNADDSYLDFDYSSKTIRESELEELDALADSILKN